MPRTIQHPARLVPLTFLLAIVLGTGLLMLPAARAGEGAAPFLRAYPGRACRHVMMARAKWSSAR